MCNQKFSESRAGVKPQQDLSRSLSTTPDFSYSCFSHSKQASVLLTAKTFLVEVFLFYQYHIICIEGQFHFLLAFCSY